MYSFPRIIHSTEEPFSFLAHTRQHTTSGFTDRDATGSDLELSYTFACHQILTLSNKIRRYSFKLEIELMEIMCRVQTTSLQNACSLDLLPAYCSLVTVTSVSLPTLSFFSDLRCPRAVLILQLSNASRAVMCIIIG